MIRRKLCAVLPVSLVAVVDRRIVRSGDVDSRDAAQLHYRIGENRRGTQGGEDVSLNSVSGKHLGTAARESVAVQAAVTGDHHAAVRGALVEDETGRAPPWREPLCIRS